MRTSRMSAACRMGLALVGLWACQAQAASIEMLAHAWTDNPSGVGRMVPGDLLRFQIGIRVDPLAGGPTGNRGLAGIVYDVIGHESKAKDYLLTPMTDAHSGFSWQGTPATVTDPYYIFSNNSTKPTYGGGWGFDTGGLPTGGFVTENPGAIIAAGILAPLFFDADVQDLFPGSQPNVRLDVGIGTYVISTDDPVVPGLQGGFGQNLYNGIPGDGTWLLQEGVIDTSGWAKQTYNFDVVPTSPTLFKNIDYNVDHSAGEYVFEVDPADAMGDAFSFTLIPEPGCLGLMLMGGLSLLRRRS